MAIKDAFEKVWVNRLSFISCLIVSAVVLAWAAHFFLDGTEQQLGRSQFAAIAERALAGARDTLVRKRSGAATIASLYSTLFPNATQWPFVAIPQFNAIAQHISLTSGGFNGELESGQGLGVVIFLQPEEIEAFNEFNRDYLERNHPPARGVYRVPFAFPNGTLRALPPSPYNISAPIAQIYGPESLSQYIMLDTFPTQLYRPMIEHFLSMSGEPNDEKYCGIFSNPLPLRAVPVEYGPTSHYAHPIFPAASNDTVRTSPSRSRS